MDKRVNPEKYMTGTFEITDEKGYLNVTGFVTVGLAIKSLFIINLGSFIQANKQNYISMGFSSIELRGLASHLIKLSYSSEQTYKKYTGGNSKSKEVRVEELDNYIKITMLKSPQEHSILVPRQDIEGLGEEIKYLVQDTTENCYLTQRTRERNKRDKKSKMKKNIPSKGQ